MAEANPMLVTFRRRYGVATSIPLTLSRNGQFGFTVGNAWTPAAGDAKISLYDGSSWTDPADCESLPVGLTAAGLIYTHALSAAEMSCKMALVYYTDNSQNGSTAAIESHSVIVETYGDASALWPYNFDLSNSISMSTPTSYGALNDVDQVVYQATAAPSLTWTILDADGAAVSLSGATVVLTVYALDGSTLFSRTSASSQITISGASNNIVTATYTTTNTATTGHYRYTLDKTNSGAERRLATGDLNIRNFLNLS